jgi:hypothetical protein
MVNKVPFAFFIPFVTDSLLNGDDTLENKVIDKYGLQI